MAANMAPTSLYSPWSVHALVEDGLWSSLGKGLGYKTVGLGGCAEE